MFWRSRARRFAKSTSSSGWSWLKQEKTNVSFPVFGIDVALQALRADLFHHALHRGVDRADADVVRIEVRREHAVARVFDRAHHAVGADGDEARGFAQIELRGSSRTRASTARCCRRTRGPADVAARSVLRRRPTRSPDRCRARLVQPPGRDPEQVAGRHHAGQRTLGALASLQQPLREVGAPDAASGPPRPGCRPGCRSHGAGSRCGGWSDPGWHAVGGAADRVGLGRDQRVDEGRQQLAQQIRGRLGELFLEQAGRVDTGR